MHHGSSQVKPWTRVEQVAFAQPSLCDSSVCEPCRPGIKNLLFLQASSWNFPTGLTTGLGPTVLCVCASGSVLNISVFVPCSSGAEEKAVFCVSPVPWELCRTVRCVNHVLQIPGTNRVCVYCASGFWWDIPVFSRSRRSATPAWSVRYCGQADQRRGTLEKLVLPSSLRPDVQEKSGTTSAAARGALRCHALGKRKGIWCLVRSFGNALCLYVNGLP